MDLTEIVSKLKEIEDPSDKEVLEKELLNILNGVRKISEGTYQIAMSAYRISMNNLHKHLGFNTFESFANEIFKLGRSQITRYIRIGNLLIHYEDIFYEEFVISMGPAKMDEIYKGVAYIEEHVSRQTNRTKHVQELAALVQPGHTVQETKSIIASYTRGLK